MAGLSDLPTELLDKICLHLPWNEMESKHTIREYRCCFCFIRESSSPSISFRCLDKSALFNFGRTCKKHFQVARRLYNQWLVIDITRPNECREIIRLLRRIHDKPRQPTPSIRRLYLVFPKEENQLEIEHIRTISENLSFLSEVASFLDFKLPDYMQKESLDRYLKQYSAALKHYRAAFGPKHRTACMYRVRSHDGWIEASYGATGCVIVLSTLPITRLQHVEHLVLQAPEFITDRIAASIRSLKQPTLPTLCSLTLKGLETRNEYHAVFDLSQLWPNAQELSITRDYFHSLSTKDWVIKWMTSISLSKTDIAERNLLGFLHDCPKLVSLTCMRLNVRDPSQPNVLYRIISSLAAASGTLKTLCLDVDFDISPFTDVTRPMPLIHTPVSTLTGFTKLENLWINCRGIYKSTPELVYMYNRRPIPTSIGQHVIKIFPILIHNRRQRKAMQSVLLETLPTSIRRLHLAGYAYRLRTSLNAVAADCSRGKLPHLREVAIENCRGKLQVLRQRFENVGLKVCDKADENFMLW